MKQLDLFAPADAGESAPPEHPYGPGWGNMTREAIEKCLPKVEDVRAKLLKVLNEAKAADEMPWTARQLQFHKTVFPQMSRWLPEDEAAQLRFEFETEIRRLLAA